MQSLLGNDSNSLEAFDNEGPTHNDSPCSINGIESVIENATNLSGAPAVSDGNARIAGFAPSPGVSQTLFNAFGIEVPPTRTDSMGTPYWEGPDNDQDGIPDSLESSSLIISDGSDEDPVDIFISSNDDDPCLS